MRHLTTEALARLVDEVPVAEEKEHLAACEFCAAELAALIDQTETLGSLPEILPPPEDWQVLEASLRSEGLIRDPSLLERMVLARTPGWMRVAAAVFLFVSGTGTGAALVTRSTATALGGPAQAASVADAASAVRVAEEIYVSAVAHYRELLAQGGGGEVGGDPIGRYAALEHLVLVSQAAVRQAPGDPFLNGFLASARAERDAAARLVSNNRDNWF